MFPIIMGLTLASILLALLIFVNILIRKTKPFRVRSIFRKGIVSSYLLVLVLSFIISTVYYLPQLEIINDAPVDTGVAEWDEYLSADENYLARASTARLRNEFSIEVSGSEFTLTATNEEEDGLYIVISKEARTDNLIKGKQYQGPAKVTSPIEFDFSEKIATVEFIYTNSMLEVLNERQDQVEIMQNIITKPSISSQFMKGKSSYDFHAGLSTIQELQVLHLFVPENITLHIDEKLAGKIHFIGEEQEGYHG